MALDLSKGMHWIGHPGSLLPIVGRGMESSRLDIEVSVETGMGNVRQVRVSRERAPRTFAMTIPNAHADDIEHVETLMAALMPPYQLVTAKMQVSNVLTPDRSVWRSLASGSFAVSLAGSWSLEGGKRSTVTALNPSAAFGNQALVRVGPFPVPPSWAERPVTISCYLGTARAAGARVILDWLDAAGVQISTGVDGTSVTGMDVLRRSTVTATPPPGAVAGRIGIVYAEILANPQVTWTAAPIPEWSLGQGVDEVVPTDSDTSTTMAVPGVYALRRGDYALSLMEVGP